MDCRSIFQSLSQTLHNPPRVRCVPLLLKIINPGRSIPSKTLAKLPSFLYGNPGLPAFGKRSPLSLPFPISATSGKRKSSRKRCCLVPHGLILFRMVKLLIACLTPGSRTYHSRNCPAARRNRHSKS